ncbi:phosphopantetheine-binding protein [Corynebacterium felinum]|uniref:Bifunctional isochorismate lyase/aryl carrier protein n=2 Tax=Corynebacterium TaxID=1716 RepID=A0ABU2B5C4_9CORY|nr:phosphopantetheine-binding protein [Corynebacterium felinum]MDF5820779.1 phosphopantetheine-binding protein [Corynebacterium felinum]MDO4761657.1 phosphopantetheine-binding protein [Corynebacterium sp.]MDR7353822.1 bifunctional isochorismate lyase/aryl carrier protein [Corynebacterium felinum]WJY95999.1 Phenyloxazoline synthase MbtB [Corynebacterium felinum]
MTEEKILNDVAEILETTPDALDVSAPIADQGLDSLRLIMIVEKWRAEGIEVDFHDILACSTLNEWRDVVGAQS